MNTDASFIGNVNPLRYRGYVYDAESGLYYCGSRYYDPAVGRWIGADEIIDTTTYNGCNLYAYCRNNPVNLADMSGYRGERLKPSGKPPSPEGAKVYERRVTAPRKDLVAAPDLDIATASRYSYNCYGNGIGKQIRANPTGYVKGDSTAKTYEAVKDDLGQQNVRPLTSIDDAIGDDEFKVAIKCGPDDYHFIRLDGRGWYNKSGTMQGLYIDKNLVAADIWYPLWLENGMVASSGDLYYNDETIFFAVKKDWYK